MGTLARCRHQVTAVAQGDRSIEGSEWLETPRVMHVGGNLTDNIANVDGSSTPFPPDAVKALSADHSTWYRTYAAAVDQLVDDQVVLPDDAAEMITRAAEFELPV